VCARLCLSTSISPKLHIRSLCVLIVALAWSASGGVPIRSSSIDDVMFAHNGQEQATRKRHILRVTPSGTAADSNFYDCMEITVDIVSLYHMTYHPMPDGSSCFWHGCSFDRTRLFSYYLTILHPLLLLLHYVVRKFVYLQK